MCLRLALPAGPAASLAERQRPSLLPSFPCPRAAAPAGLSSATWTVRTANNVSLLSMVLPMYAAMNVCPPWANSPRECVPFACQGGSSWTCGVRPPWQGGACGPGCADMHAATSTALAQAWWASEIPAVLCVAPTAYTSRPLAPLCSPGSVRFRGGEGVCGARHHLLWPHVQRQHPKGTRGRVSRSMPRAAHSSATLLACGAACGGVLLAAASATNSRSPLRRLPPIPPQPLCCSSVLVVTYPKYHSREQVLLGETPPTIAEVDLRGLP